MHNHLRIKIMRTMMYLFIILIALTSPAATPAQAQEPTTQVLVATATCDVTGNKYDEVRFTLSGPTTVRVRFDIDGTWWIMQMPAGPTLANVIKGEVVIPGPFTFYGGTLREYDFLLPPGTFLLHVDCSGSPGRSARALLTLPASPPAPLGPYYWVVGRAHAEPSGIPPDGWEHGYNDRLFVLTARQVVSFQPNPYLRPSEIAGEESTGWISDFAGTTWWAIDYGTIRTGSTLDLPAGNYCLHVDYAKHLPVAFSDQWILSIVGPSQPGGAKTSTTALFNPNPIGSETKYQDAAFVLAAPQVVTISSQSVLEATYWIVDLNGIRWFSVINGLTQSSSSWVNPPPGRDPARPRSVGGVLLPAGTYLLHVDQGGPGTGRSSVSLEFVGTAIDAFPWPVPIRYPCYDRPSLLAVIRRAIEQRIQLAVIRQAIEERIQEFIRQQAAARPPVTLTPRSATGEKKCWRAKPARIESEYEKRYGGQTKDHNVTYSETTFALQQGGKSNTITWNKPPDRICAGDPVTLAINSTSNEGALVLGGFGVRGRFKTESGDLNRGVQSWGDPANPAFYPRSNTYIVRFENLESIWASATSWVGTGYVPYADVRVTWEYEK